MKVRQEIIIEVGTSYFIQLCNSSQAKSQITLALQLSAPFGWEVANTDQIKQRDTGELYNHSLFWREEKVSQLDFMNNT